jgi:pyruvate-ferredoxin/flavodoxin oxidoreductase
VQSGAWSLYRYNPDWPAVGKPALIIDSKAPSIPLEQYIYNETRYRMLTQSDGPRAEALLHQAQQEVRARRQLLERLAALQNGGEA